MTLRGTNMLTALLTAGSAGAVALCVAWMLTASPLRPTAVYAAPPPDLRVPAGPSGQTRSIVAPVPSGPDGRADITGTVPEAVGDGLDQPAVGADSTTLVALNRKPDPKPKRGREARGLTILHIGDSHTSADFFTGDLRRLLQARYGDGGPGYVTAGHPHIGVRSATLDVTNSSGWTYKALQKSDAISEFWLSGFNAVAVAAGETMTFSANHFITFDLIEVEVVRQPGGGAIDIKLDGAVESQFDLEAPKAEPVVIRLLPTRGATDRVKQITIATTRAGTVDLSSVAIYNRHTGVTYNSVGYPGATVGIINKFDDTLFASELRRLDPQIVVVSFGSNEGFNDDLDLDRYAQNYERAIRKIKATLPSAVIVVIGPPDGNDTPAHCRDKASRTPCRRGSSVARPPASSPPAAPADAAPDTAATPAEPVDCAWRTPFKLNSVRDIQRDIAQREGLVYWNWASIMPRECGADRWATQTPPLMAHDHLHFTRDGYRLSANQFAKMLIPIIEQVRASANAVSNN